MNEKRFIESSFAIYKQDRVLCFSWEPGPLKATLKQGSEVPLRKTDFSIGHRGAAQQFPEHTKESYKGAARMGAGIVECDVTFTKDKQLVCRHSQCDLHTTTNILATPLARKCSKALLRRCLIRTGR
jgi:glycerophosphoryl diester phosphodiesterase